MHELIKLKDEIELKIELYSDLIERGSLFSAEGLENIKGRLEVLEDMLDKISDIINYL